MARFGDYTAPTYRRPRDVGPRPSLKNLKHLLRLAPYFARYRGYLVAVLGGILASRALEALIPLLTHSLGVSIAHAVTRRSEDDYFCYFCLQIRLQ